MVKMAKNRKKQAVLYIDSTKLVAYMSWSLFSNKLLRPVLEGHRISTTRREKGKGAALLPSN